ncbi:pilus assembly protein TadG-related protein [Rhodoluna sp.]|uniref:pilus assembly protein TadG-related protein n=1 Tax=Rhodoluna sp. TaxID=1969481 RepID=UPI00344BB18E
MRSERGSITPLALGATLFTALVILAISLGSSMFVVQKRLTTLAEGAALAVAADQMTVNEFLALARNGEKYRLEVAQEKAEDGLTVQVSICTSLALGGWFVSHPIKVCANGAARSE